MTRIAFSVGTLAIIGAALCLHVALAQQPGVTRVTLQQRDLSVPDREVVQVRVGLATGVVFPRHTHPGDEIVYVLEGTLEYQVAGRRPETLNAGQVVLIPAGTIHSVTNVGRGKGVELATYIVVKGKPLLSIVE